MINKNYLALRYFVIVWAVTILLFSVISMINCGHVISKSIEIAQFFISFILSFFICFLVLKKFQWTERGAKGDSHEPVNKYFAIFIFVLLVIIYLVAAFIGVSTNFFTIDLFGTYKEFGHHLDALIRFEHGSYPWLDFAYPYGFYSVLLARVILSIVHSADSILLADIILNIISLSIVVWSLKNNGNKRSIIFGSLLLLIYLSPDFFTSFYNSGLHSTWFRYISPLLFIIFFPEDRCDKFRIFLWGFSSVLISFFAPELAPLTLFALIFASCYLFRKFNRQSLSYYWLGSALAFLPFMYFWASSPVSVATIFGNIYYQVQFIVNYNQLTAPLLNPLVCLKNLILSQSLQNVKTTFFSVLYYLPVSIIIWQVGYLYINRINKNVYWFKVLFISVAIFVINLKFLGLSSIGYALLSIPISIVGITIIYRDRRPSGVLLIILVFVGLASLYSMQQRYFPCLSSPNGDACIFQSEHKNDPKKAISLNGASIVQKYHHSQVADFEELVNYLNRYDSDRVLILADLTSLYFFLDANPTYRIMLPSLYFSKDDFEEIRSKLHEADAVVLPEPGYNFVDADYLNKIIDIYPGFETEFSLQVQFGPLLVYGRRF